MITNIAAKSEMAMIMSQYSFRLRRSDSLHDGHRIKCLATVNCNAVKVNARSIFVRRSIG